MTQPVKIVYVDDEPLLKMAFVEALKREGYDVFGSTGGESVFDLIRDEQPDIVILDIMMKPLDGWSILLTIKDYPAFDGMAVIMQTGKSLNLRDFFTYGEYIDNYLVKPVRIPDMIRSIQEVVARNEEIAADVKRAREMGIDEALILEYARVKRKVVVSKNLLETLSRLYPILNDESAISNNENPEITAVVDKHAADVENYEKLKTEIFG